MNYIIFILSLISVLVIFSLMVFKTSELTNYFSNKHKYRSINNKEDFDNVVESLIDSINNKKKESFKIHSISKINKNKENFKVELNLVNKNKIEPFVLDFDSNETFTNLKINEMFNVNKVKDLEYEIENEMEGFTPRDTQEMKDRTTNDLPKYRDDQGNIYGPNEVTFKYVDTPGKDPIRVAVLKTNQATIVTEIPHIHYDENGDPRYDNEIITNADGNMVLKENPSIRVYHMDDPNYIGTPTRPIVDLDLRYVTSDKITQLGYDNEVTDLLNNILKRYTELNDWNIDYNKSKATAWTGDNTWNTWAVGSNFTKANELIKMKLDEQKEYLRFGVRPPNLNIEIQRMKDLWEQTLSYVKFKSSKLSASECQQLCGPVCDSIGCRNNPEVCNLITKQTDNPICDVCKENDDYLTYIKDPSCAKFDGPTIKSRGDFKLVTNMDEYFEERNSCIKITPNEDILKMTLGGECLDNSISKDNLKELLSNFTLYRTNTLLQNNISALDDTITDLLEYINKESITLEHLSSLLFDFQNARKEKNTRPVLRETIDNDFIAKFKEYIIDINSKITTSSLYKPKRFKYDIEKYDCRPMFSPILLQSRVAVDDKGQLFNSLRN